MTYNLKCNQTKSHKNKNVTITEMSQKLTGHNNWNVTTTEMFQQNLCKKQLYAVKLKISVRKYLKQPKITHKKICNNN